MARVRPDRRRLRLAEFPLRPVPIREGLHGGPNLYAVQAEAFDDARELATTFASYAAVAVHNMHLFETTRELADILDIAMRTRAVIEQAKGILMSQRRCDATEAFNLLAAASQRSNRKLRDIAQAIVDGVTGQDSRQNSATKLSDDARVGSVERPGPAIRWERHDQPR